MLIRKLAYVILYLEISDAAAILNLRSSKTV
jgi:hypothetical protein